jgi:WD40 repeat protein
MASDPAGQYLAISPARSEIGVWDIASQKLEKELVAGAQVLSVHWSPNGRFLAAAVDSEPGRVKVWTAANWSVVRTIDVPRKVLAVAFSPDAEFMAVGQPTGGVLVYSVKDGKLMAQGRTVVPPEEGPCIVPISLSYGPRGDCLAAAFFPYGVQVWSTRPEGDG